MKLTLSCRSSVLIFNFLCLIQCVLRARALCLTIFRVLLCFSLAPLCMCVWLRVCASVKRTFFVFQLKVRSAVCFNCEKKKPRPTSITKYTSCSSMLRLHIPEEMECVFRYNLNAFSMAFCCHSAAMFCVLLLLVVVVVMMALLCLTLYCSYCCRCQSKIFRGVCLEFMKNFFNGIFTFQCAFTLTCSRSHCWHFTLRFALSTTWPCSFARNAIIRNM